MNSSSNGPWLTSITSSEQVPLGLISTLSALLQTHTHTHTDCWNMIRVAATFYSNVHSSHCDGWDWVLRNLAHSLKSSHSEVACEMSVWKAALMPWFYYLHTWKLNFTQVMDANGAFIFSALAVKKGTLFLCNPKSLSLQLVTLFGTDFSMHSVCFIFKYEFLAI